MFGNRQCIVHMPLHPQGQRFQTDDIQEAVEWSLAAAQITQTDHARADDEGQITHQIGKNGIMIRGFRLDQVWMPSTGFPVEFATVHNHPADAQAMTANPFGGGMHDNVHTMIEGAPQVRSGEGVIHDDGKTVCMRQLA